MNNTQRVLFLSEKSATLVPMLEEQFAEQKPKVKFISPVQVYKSDFDDCEFIMLDYDFYLEHSEMMKDVFSYPNKLSIFTTLTDSSQLNTILKQTKVSHLFGMSGNHTINDMKCYLQAMIQNKFWTPETFISPPVTHQSKTFFTSSEHLDQQIDKALSAHDFTSSFDGFKAVIIQILNETLTNALYNAPVDKDGNHLNKKTNRRTAITCDEKNAPILEILEDEEKMILSVKDLYGSLKKDVIDHFVTHGQVAEKEGGAGVGLFLILKHAHKVVINIDPGKSTEFLIVLHKFKRFFHYQNLEKSFHVYQRSNT